MRTNMQTTRLMLSIVLVGTLVGTAAPACKSDPTSKASAITTPSAHPADDPDDLGAPKYAVCSGQGGNPHQLAPGFLDKMDACERADSAPADTLSEMAGDGAIIAGKGDCQFGHGISCHFHTSMEFVTTGRLKDDERGVGELHCIAPSAYPNSPIVYGAHLRCKAGTSPAAGAAACRKALVQLLDHTHCRDGWRCCDNGTLTKPVGKQAPEELKLRPDFRVCQDESIEIDCGLLRDMHGHTANVVGLGEEFTGAFNADHAHDRGR